MFIMRQLPSILGEDISIASRLYIHGLEFIVFLHLDRLPHKVREPTLPYNLTNDWDEHYDSYRSQKLLYESDRNIHSIFGLIPVVLYPHPLSGF